MRVLFTYAKPSSFSPSGTRCNQNDTDLTDGARWKETYTYVPAVFIIAAYLLQKNSIENKPPTSDTAYLAPRPLARRCQMAYSIAWRYAWLVSRIDHGTGPDLSWNLYLVRFSLIFLFVPCGGLSWLHVSFLLHVKYTISYRIVSCTLCPKKVVHHTHGDNS